MTAQTEPEREITDLLDIIEGKDEEIRTLAEEVESKENTIDDLNDRIGDLRAQLEEPPEELSGPAMAVLRNIGAVLPEGEDVVSESVAVFNLRRALEDLWHALNPSSKHRPRNPWVRGSEQRI